MNIPLPTISRHRASRTCLLGALLSGLLGLSACDSPPTLAGGSDDTHSTLIDVQGRVLTKDARPYGDVIVRLRGLDLYDTTDSEGRFQLVAPGPSVASRTQGAVDTLDYMREGQVVVSAPVPAWISVLPDLMLVQRDISGTLRAGEARIGRVVARLALPDHSSQTVDLEYSQALGRYSGFAYFRYSPGLDSFSLQVEVLDPEGNPLGASPEIPFTSRTGDLLVPEFDLDASLPVLHLGVVPLGERGVSIPATFPESSFDLDTVRAGNRQNLALRLRVEDPDRCVRTIRWVLPDGREVTVDCSPGSETEFTLDTLLAASEGRVGARAIDRSGREVSRILPVRIVPTPPQVSVLVEEGREVSPGETFALQVAASDHFDGQVVVRKIWFARSDLSDSSPVAQVENVAMSVLRERPEDGAGTPLQQASARVRSLMASAPGEIVPSGRVEFSIHRDSMPGHRLAVVLAVDSDGDSSVAWTVVTIRPAPPAIRAVKVRSDSVEFAWSPGGIGGLSYAEVWGMQVIWHGTGDTLSREDGPQPGRWVVVRPREATGLTFRVRELFGVAGRESDTSLEFSALPPSDSNQIPRDSQRVEDSARDAAMRASVTTTTHEAARISAIQRQGVALEEPVVSLTWHLDSSLASSVAWAGFLLPEQVSPGARTSVRIRCANLSSRAVRVSILHDRALPASTDRYLELLDRGVDLGWWIPAGFIGEMDLLPGDATWSEWATEADTLGMDRSGILAVASGVGVSVRSLPQEPPTEGVIEIASIR
ncbi:MAG: hypothetical protein H6686_06265 [Fibrobacteria bacterium]|nr:hypothetical protein [Fibrobacteria bacterium]